MVADSNGSHQEMATVVSVQKSASDDTSGFNQAYRKATMIVEIEVSVAPTITTTKPGRRNIVSLSVGDSHTSASEKMVRSPHQSTS